MPYVYGYPTGNELTWPETGPVRIGLTGSRYGLTDAQAQRAIDLVNEELDNITGWHQGGCVGADNEVSQILRYATGVPQDVWPGQVAARWKADWSHDPLAVIHETMPPLVRNGLIVDHCDWLWSFPNTPTDPGRGRGGGTWQTIRYAITRKVTYSIITPDGTETRYIWESF